jgi:hypothetical protein
MAVVAMVDPEMAENTVPSDDRHHRQATRHAADQPFHPVDHLESEAGVEQDLAHQDEQRNRRQREIDDRHDAVAHNLEESGLAAEKQPGADDVDSDER